MTKDQLNLLLWTLANGHPCNTSGDYSVSIRESFWNNRVYDEVNVFPADGLPWFIDMAVEHLLGIAVALNLHLSFKSSHGVPVAHFC